MSNDIDEQDTSPPTAGEIAFRAVALKYVITRAHTVPSRPAFKAKLEGKNNRELAKLEKEAEQERDEFVNALVPVQNHFSPWEAKFLRETSFTMTVRQQINASWRIEAFQVLLWALGGLKQIPPYDATAAHKIVELFPSPRLKATDVRPEDVIEQEREDAELWHWRSRTRQLIEDGHSYPESLRTAELKSHDDVVRSIARSRQSDRRIAFANEDFSVFGKPYRELSDDEWSTVRSITMERHFALNWLCGYAPGNEWDETPTDT